MKSWLLNGEPLSVLRETGTPNLVNILSKCDTMWSFIVLGVYAPVRESLCLLWRETQTKGLSLRSPVRPEVDEERKVPERTEGQLAKEDGERQLTTVNRRRQEKMEAGQRRESTEVRNATAKTR